MVSAVDLSTKSLHKPAVGVTAAISRERSPLCRHRHSERVGRAAKTAHDTKDTHLSQDFVALGLADELLAALKQAGYETPTPIQAQAIPHVLADRDMIAIAQTGTGKTAAFVLPIIDILDDTDQRVSPKHVRALILAPTRELVVQIAETVERFARPFGLSHTTVFGGVGHGNQIKALARGVDILIACPGRLLDLMQSRCVRLDQVAHLVLDEADRMFDMGFMRDVTKIIAATPAATRQTLLFSATMPNEVASLCASVLRDPVRVEVTPEVVTVEKIDQTIYAVSTNAKRALLLSLLKDESWTRVAVFTRTKHGANRLAEQLEKAGVSSDAIHGNKSQGARQRALDGFKAGNVRVLVATDIAARGIDVDNVSHVVNFDMPVEPEAYVHRIGRTARAGKAGIAVSFCDVANERDQLRAIERVTRLRFELKKPDFSAMPDIASTWQPEDNRVFGHGNGQRERTQDGRGRGRPQRRPGATRAA